MAGTLVHGVAGARLARRIDGSAGWRTLGGRCAGHWWVGGLVGAQVSGLAGSRLAKRVGGLASWRVSECVGARVGGWCEKVVRCMGPLDGGAVVRWSGK